MRIVTGKKVLWLGMALVLSACSTVGNKTPDELVRQGIQRNLLHDNQFNFNGQIRLLADQDEVKKFSDKVADQALDHKTEATDSASSSESVRKKQAAKISAEANKKSYCAHDNSAEDCDKKNESLNGALSFIAQKTTIPFSGAIDIPRGKFEFVPAVRYEASNILFSIKVPVQIDIKEKMLIADVRAIKPFASVINAIFPRMDQSPKILNKPYIAKKFPERANNLPLKELILAAPKAIDDGYASYDKKAFARLSIDEAGKKIGARYRIRLNSTDEQDRVMAVAVVDSLSEQLKQSEIRETNLKAKANQLQKKDYAAIQKLLAEKREQILSDKLGKIKYDSVITDFYLDDRGRLLAMHEMYRFIFDNSRISRVHRNKTINTSLWIQFDYTSHPKFTLNQTPENTVYRNNK
ncbi:hypothetical protein [Snodgrassella sp. ESL0253]|uniref:hypothetical protein n=1 Tax=Snodgrassella sp. ESL0253 TaxID=2705031 RepID=UPI001582FD08|nr:hypothetical protein [Snodgrassella sp. ESL0253]NUE66576.1 hypothetical protein [Snodgrassella sp. ESL0253]